MPGKPRVNRSTRPDPDSHVKSVFIAEYCDDGCNFSSHVGWSKKQAVPYKIFKSPLPPESPAHDKNLPPFHFIGLLEAYYMGAVYTG
jgi:hypothetical protein